jgi:uncharacterized protein YcbK (DUF882 family)
MRDRCWRALEAGQDEPPRRELLKHILAIAVLPAALCGARAGHTAGVDAGPAEPGSATERWIELRNLHTNEMVNTRFETAQGFVPEALARLRHLLRDYRNGEEHEMDTGLYGQLSDLARAAGVAPRYEVISGYRSPATNAMLHATGHAVSEHSLHMQGRAIDVRLRGYNLAALRDLALAARRGGVGYYPRSNFIHIDTGRVRRWQEE